jgi:translation initiation factor 2 beta subunit (eIF-2beta)/eIF-5
MGLDKDDIKQLIAILQKGLIDEDPDQSQENSKPKPKKQIATKNTQKTKKGNRQYKNIFESMPEHNMHKDDVLIDQKLKRFPPTQRSRNFKPLSVKCRVCGKTETVNPSLIESSDRYKCNKCSSSAG